MYVLGESNWNHRRMERVKSRVDGFVMSSDGISFQMRFIVALVKYSNSPPRATGVLTDFQTGVEKINR